MYVSHYEPALHRVLWELREYLDDVVVIGGWVPYLYSQYGGFATWKGRTSLTMEVDVLVDRPLPPGERPSIPEILRNSGFHPSTDAGGTAVWLGDVRAGEMIEFLVPHTGTGRQQGDVVAVAAQGGLRAISLPGLELMRVYKRQLPVPLSTDGGERVVQVWVPWLGAYVTNKSCTFARRDRHADGLGSKRPKDLLYLRDIMAAGPEVVERMEQDLGEMARTRSGASRIRDAVNNLRMLVNGCYAADVADAAAMLREREPGFSDSAALADIRGHLTDLAEILPDD